MDCLLLYGRLIVPEGVFKTLVPVSRETRRKRGENEGGRKTKWLQLAVETKRRRGQIIYKRWGTSKEPPLHDCTLSHTQLVSHSFHNYYFVFLPIPWQESERLEMLNSDLKAQIEELKLERQQLILMLNRHRPTCIVRTDSVKTPEDEVSPLLQQLEAKWRL